MRFRLNKKWNRDRRELKFKDRYIGNERFRELEGRSLLLESGILKFMILEGDGEVW